MRIHFRLAWLKRAGSFRSAFKSVHAYSLFAEYTGRISKFTPYQVSGVLKKNEAKNPGTKIWICDRGAGAKALSSEALASHLEKLRGSGTRELQVFVGGHDGFSKGEIEALKPDLLWSFGPLTFPHELAAIVASEQIYRAFTILKRLPYHTAHSQLINA